MVSMILCIDHGILEILSIIQPMIYLPDLNVSNKESNGGARIYLDLTLMDGIDEQMPLTLIERNLRKILKRHILKLLGAKRMYYKSIYKGRDNLFGDENSKKKSCYGRYEL